MKISSVGIFCGSAIGNRPGYLACAQKVGTFLAKSKRNLVYGGGNVGLMGAVADAALSAGGTVIGVIPQSLVEREVAQLNLTQLHIVQTMHERKALMAKHSDAFIALPGGFGTFDEICEMITWNQLAIHKKPCGFLDVENYYAPLKQLVENGCQEGFIRSANAERLVFSDNIQSLLERFEMLA